MVYQTPTPMYQIICLSKAIKGSLACFPFPSLQFPICKVPVNLSSLVFHWSPPNSLQLNPIPVQHSQPFQFIAIYNLCLVSTQLTLLSRFYLFFKTNLKAPSSRKSSLVICVKWNLSLSDSVQYYFWVEKFLILCFILFLCLPLLYPSTKGKFLENMDTTWHIWVSSIIIAPGPLEVCTRKCM